MIRRTFFNRIKSIIFKEPPKSKMIQKQAQDKSAVAAATPKVNNLPEGWSDEEWEEWWVASSLFPI